MFVNAEKIYIMTIYNLEPIQDQYLLAFMTLYRYYGLILQVRGISGTVGNLTIIVEGRERGNATMKIMRGHRIAKIITYSGF